MIVREFSLQLLNHMHSFRLIRATHFLLLCICLCACSTEQELPLPEADPQLVVNGLFTPDSTWKINVSRSNTLAYYEFEPVYVENAVVRLWAEDSLLGTLAYAGRGNYRLATYPRAGVTYRVRVEAPGYEAVEASDRIPLSVPQIENPQWDFTRRVTLSDNDGVVYSSFPINFDLIDPRQTTNRYLIQLAQRDSCDCRHLVSYPHVNRLDEGLLLYGFTTRFPLGESVAKQHGLLMFSNTLLTARSTPIECYQDTSALFHIHYESTTGSDTLWLGQATSYGYDHVSPKPYIRTYLDAWNMSEALYRYHLSYLTQAYNTSDPFAVHINLYSNLSNRRGIFAGYQRKWFLLYQRG